MKNNNYFLEIENQYGISPLPETVVPAMAYVPYQGEKGEIYSPEKGMEAGTMFPVLDKPFEGRTLQQNAVENLLEE